MIKVIYPSDRMEDYEDYKLVFLAGPILGATDWREMLIDKLTRLNVENKSILLASPQTLFGVVSSRFDLAHQVSWEMDHMEAAIQRGILAFWLDREVIGIPNRSFAQTSRFELGEYFERMKTIKSDNFVIGYHERFHGMAYLKLRFSYHKNLQDVSFHTDFDKFCESIYAKI